MDGVSETGVKRVHEPKTVSDRIRELARDGYSRADIARMLGKRYQHIRNVLEADKLKASTDPEFVGESDTLRDGPKRFRFVVRADGSISLSREAQIALGVKPGGVLIGTATGEDMVLTEGSVSNRRAQRLAMIIDRGRGSVVDEFIADRRLEAERELHD